MLNNQNLFFDLDGTLLGASRKLHPDTRETLHKLQNYGNRIYLCSGRPPKYLQKMVYPLFPFDGMVACAGGCVYAGEQLLLENEIPLSLIDTVLDMFRQRHIFWQFDTINGTYSTPEMDLLFEGALNKAMQFDPSRMEQFRKEQQKLADLGVNHPISNWNSQIRVQKIIFSTADAAQFEEIIPILEKEFVINYFFRSADALAGELFPLNCTKAQGIARILEHTGASWENTIGFGDSRNDLEMLQAVRVKVAAVYAPEELKAAADLYFEDPDRGGIARILEQLDQK